MDNIKMTTDNSYCRLCAELTPNIDLISVNSNTTNLNFKISQCFQIHIENDDKLPRCICSTCCEQVQSTYEFNERIHRAQEVLKDLFDTIDNKDFKIDWNDTTSDQQNSISSAIKQERNWDDHDNDDDDDFLGSFDIKSESDDDVCLSERKTRKRRKKRKLKNSDFDNSDFEGDGGGVKKVELKARLKRILEEWKNYKWQCSSCPSELNSVKELRDHYESEHDKPPIYKCNECSKPYSNYELFKRHVRAHRNKHKYRCETCGKYSYNRSMHEQHTVKHSVVRKFMCSTCGRSFKTQGSLRIHGRRHLPDEQKYKYECDICNKKFTSGPNLTAHKKIHLGIKQYTCEQCGNNFTQKVNLEHHILSRHTDEHPCHCDECPKVFKNIFRLRRHQKIHSDIKPYECDVCGKKYRRGSDLKIHQRIHSGELPYECEHCKKRFRMKKFLQVHIRQHTGERPYSCMDCNHHFANSSNYIKHMKAKHGVSSFKNLTKNQNKQKLFDTSYLTLLDKAM